MFPYQLGHSGLESPISGLHCWVGHGLNAVESFVINVLHGVLFQERSEHGLDCIHII